MKKELFLAIIGKVIEWFTSYIGLTLYGFEIEANPLIRKFGFKYLHLANFGFICYLITMYYLFNKYYQKEAKYCRIFFVIVFLVHMIVVFHNIGIFSLPFF